MREWIHKLKEEPSCGTIAESMVSKEKGKSHSDHPMKRSDGPCSACSQKEVCWIASSLEVEEAQEAVTIRLATDTVGLHQFSGQEGLADACFDHHCCRHDVVDWTREILWAPIRRQLFWIQTMTRKWGAVGCSREGTDLYQNASRYGVLLGRSSSRDG